MQKVCTPDVFIEDVSELHRSRDVGAFSAVLSHYPELVGDLDQAKDWVDNPKNVLLRRDDDFGMLSFEYPGLYTAHYFFDRSRGAAALTLARLMLRKMFTDYAARSIQGMTPIWNRKANWLTRRLGFTAYGEIDTPEAGPCTHFIITIDEFFEKNKGKL